jgi:hypothetical protein
VNAHGQSIEIEHLGHGKCRRFLLNSSGLVGGAPGSQPFRLPPLKYEFASTGKILSPLVQSTLLRSTFSFVATTKWSVDAFYCVSRDPVQLKVTGPGVGGSPVSNTYRVENDPCTYRDFGHGDYLSTVPNATYLVTVVARTPVEWASAGLAAENRAPG